MPIQTGILPAGSTLTVDYSIGETATISYQDGDIGVVDNGQTKTTDRTIGPFANDVAYSIDYTGWPKVFTTAAGGAITTISLPLPDPASLPAGKMISVDGDVSMLDANGIVSSRNKSADAYVGCWSGATTAGSGPAINLVDNVYCEIYPASLLGEGALTEVQMWANSGYITSTAGAGGDAKIPLTHFTYDLSKDVIVINVGINAAAPATTSPFFGNGTIGGTSAGIYLRAKADGKVEVVTSSTINSVLANTILATSAGVFFDSTDHNLMVVIHPTGYCAIFKDGSLDWATPIDWTARKVGSTAPVFSCSVGGTAGTSATAIAGKWFNIHVMKFGALPLNLGYMARKIHKNPGVALTQRDVIIAQKTVLCYWGAGQSNENGSGNTRGFTGDLGVPWRDNNTRSIVSQVNYLMAKRGVAMLWVTNAQGSSSAAEMWAGRVRNWQTGLLLATGSHVIYAGNVYKAACTAGTESTVAPAVGTGADSVTWALVGAVTADDTATAAGTGVYSATSSRFDPNGWLAAGVAKSAVPATSIDYKVALISIGQGDRTHGVNQVSYADALIKIANYHVANGAQVMLGMTCNGSSTTDYSSKNGGGSANAANTTQSAWYAAELLPGYHAALSAAVDNVNVFKGHDWAEDIGTLTTVTYPHLIGTKSDKLHMTDITYETKAAPLTAEAFRNMGL